MTQFHRLDTFNNVYTTWLYATRLMMGSNSQTVCFRELLRCWLYPIKFVLPIYLLIEVTAVLIFSVSLKKISFILEKRMWSIFFWLFHHSITWWSWPICRWGRGRWWCCCSPLRYCSRFADIAAGDDDDDHDHDDDDDYDDEGDDHDVDRDGEDDGAVVLCWDAAQGLQIAQLGMMMMM